jgi:hypothetical protein
MNARIYVYARVRELNIVGKAFLQLNQFNSVGFVGEEIHP